MLQFQQPDLNLQGRDPGFISLITILLFLVLIGVFGWGIYYFRQQPINRELPSRIQLDQPKPTPSPGQVKSYSNLIEGFSFEYPVDWKVREVVVQSSKTLQTLLELSPSDYNGMAPFNLRAVDNPDRLSLKDLDQKLSGKPDATILYSTDDVYMLTGSGLTVFFRKAGDCKSQPCQVYTFAHDAKVYQLESFLGANIFEQKQIFDRIISSFNFDDFSQR